MRGTEAVTVTADRRKPATSRAFLNAETLSGSRSAQAVHAALGAAGHRLGQFAFLVLTLCFALCAGTTGANALSDDCTRINSEWSAGVTFDAASLSPGYHDLFDEYNLADGETLTWSVTGSGVLGSNTFAAFYIGDGDAWVHSESSDQVGSFSDSGSHTFSAGNTYAILQAVVNKSGEPAYIDDPATVTMTVSCSEGSPPSTVATLSGLVLSQGTLDPVFASGTTSYTASVGNAVTSLTVTPTVTDANATVTVNGNTVTSGNASSAINLNVGDNTITVVGTAQDGTTTQTYTVTVTRAAPVSTVATLSGLVLSQGTLDPVFASGTTSYTASVGNAVTSLTVTPTVTDANATVTVNTVPVLSGNASGAINLTVGSNIITVVVTAEDGTTTETYTVDITRAAATDATLSNLVLSQGTLDPVFASGTTSYTASVGNAVTSLTVTPTVTDANATVTVNTVPVTSGNASGAINLNVGSNVITVVVTAEDGTTTETYTVDVTRAAPASTDATLANLVLSQGTLDPVFASGTTSYTASVGNAVTSLTVTPTVTDANATVTVNGNTVTSGNASGAINLTVGDNTLTIIVTAQNGTTTETYTVTVNRAAPAATDATLANLVLSQGTLDPVFASGTTSYTASVGNAVTSLTVTPTVTDANASVTVNNVAVISGNASGAINLNVGDNTITVVGTAQDGTTTETYTVTVNRAAAPVTITLSPVAGSLTAGQVSTAYTQSVTASGGTGPYTYAVTSGALPAGLTLNTNTGDISGTPTTAGTANFTITATDANNDTGSAAYSLLINAAPATITLSPAAGSLTAGQVSTAYTQSVTASGGTGPYTYAVTNGALPAGLSLDTGTGDISGTPTTAGTANFTITATDANNDTGSAAYSLQINAAPVTITLSPAAGSLTAGQVGTAYSQTFTASGGSGSYSYAVTSGALPAGLSLDTNGALTGTPTTAGTANFTITATDANNDTGSAAYSLLINAAPVTITLSPAAGSLTAGQVGTAYSQTFTASGGSGSYSYAVTSGALPAGLSLDTNGALTGTPITAGTANFTITATDANSATGSAAYSLLINAAPASNVATLGNLVLSQGTLTPGFASGTTSYTASVGDAVTSLSVTPAATDANATITVNGMPVTSGNASGAINLVTGNNAITVVVTAQDGVTTQTYTITVNRAAPPASIALSPAAGGLTAGQAGTAYSQTFTASGGTGPYTYAITSGSLPAGLTLAGTGELTGTPTSAGTANFTVTATDANNDTGSAAYSLQVTAPPASISFSPAGGALPEAMAGEDYTAAITVSGGTGPYLFSVSAGALPPGMVLNVSTGALNGPLNADAEGSYSFTIQVSDASNAVASAAYTLEVKKRAVTVTDKVVTVPAGSTPGNVNLAAGATGGPFIDANLLSVEPANAGTARIVNSQFAQAGGGGSAGFYLKFTPNPSYSGQVIIRFSLTSDLGVSNTGSVIYNLGYNPEKVATEIDSIVRGFVRTRQGLIANAVKVPGLRDRRRMQTANEIVSMRFTPSERGMSLGFATSLEQMKAASNALTPDLKAEAMAFNVWIQGSASAHTRKQNDGRWGSFAMLSAGADYLLADWALLGVSFHYDRMSDPTPNGARLSGNGWLAGPYASIEVYRNVFWDTRLFVGGSSNDIDTEFWDGNFDTTRWMADTALSGEWNLDAATTLSPTLRAVYLSEKVKDYGVRNSVGDQILMDGFIEEQFRVSGALELARLFILDNGMLLTPAVELTGGYAGLGGRGAFGAAEGSLTLTDGSRWRLNAGVKVNVEGDGSTSLTAKAGAGIRF